MIADLVLEYSNVPLHDVSCIVLHMYDTMKVIVNLILEGVRKRRRYPGIVRRETLSYLW